MIRGLVSIIIATHNNEDTLGACLASISNQAYKNHETIVVDNGSKDGTRGIIDPKKIRLVSNERNLGFSKANNQALAIASGEYVLFLNADAFIDKNYLSAIIPYFERDQKLGSVSGKICRPGTGGPRIIDSAGLLIEHWRFLPRDRGEGEIDSGQYEETAPVFGTPGACAFYRRAALESAVLGQEYMDEDFFAYYEDVDLAWRIRRKGWATLYVPGAVAYHQKKGPQGKDDFIQIKALTNRYWCYVKNALIMDFLLYAPLAIPWETIRIFKIFSLKPSWIKRYFGEWRLLSKMRKKRFALYICRRKTSSDAQFVCHNR